MIGRIVREAAWAPIAVIVSHAVAGELFGHEPYVDPVMHFLGGAAAALFIHRTASIAVPLFGKPSPLALDLLAFGLACTAALFWELAEFFADRWLGSNLQKGVPNTMRDLLLGTLGATLYVGAGRLRPRAGTTGDTTQ